jgi:hypothetical protein
MAFLPFSLLVFCRHNPTRGNQYISNNRHRDGSVSESDRLIARSTVDLTQFITILVLNGLPFIAGKQVQGFGIIV